MKTNIANMNTNKSEDSNKSIEDSADLAARWERLHQHHSEVGKAFHHMVIAGIEIVSLRLSMPHGSFAKEAQERIPSLAQRTIRRYRQVGEWFLSATHGRVVTVARLRDEDQRPQDALCSDEAVTEYLQRSQIQNAEDLEKHAREKVPALFEKTNRAKGCRVDNLMEKVARAWSRMPEEQKTEFVQRFEEFRLKPKKEKSPLTNAKPERLPEPESGLMENKV